MRLLGMISGTSHDGIDVAIVNFEAADDDLVGTIEYTATVPYSSELRSRLMAALPPARTGFDMACELDTRIGREFAAAGLASLEAHAARAGTGPVDAVCSHGQTVFHWIEDGTALGTLQLGQPAWIAEATGLPVISDLRAADVAAGGQGAPLVPILDRFLLEPARATGHGAAALNLGGIANVTVCMPGREPMAWDIGPGNALLDAVVQASDESSDTFDRDGALAAAGAIDADLLAVLLAEPYFAAPAPKSSGKELFHAGYVRAAEIRSGGMLPLRDLVATLTELTAVTVARAILDTHVDYLVISGGGTRNPTLMARLRTALPNVRVLTSDEVGVPSDDKEAIAFALIGWATLHGLAANVPSCTGARGPRVLGRVTPALRATVASSSFGGSWPTSLAFVELAPRHPDDGFAAPSTADPAPRVRPARPA